MDVIMLILTYGLSALKIVEWGFEAYVKSTETTKDDVFYEKNIKPHIKSFDVVLTVFDKLRRLFRA